MELKEIKCKNCGANLKVDPKEKMVTCEYCKSTFSVDDDYTKSYNSVKGALDAQRDSIPKANKILISVFLVMFVVIFVGGFIFRIVTMKNGFKIFSSVINSSIDTDDNDSDITNDIIEDAEAEIVEEETNEYDGFYNSKFETYAGTEWGSSIKYVIDDINTNNKTKNHKIIVSYNGIETTEQDALINIKDSLDKWTEYEVTFDYNEDGYIYKMNIINK